jgi:hypothetical protein
MSEALDPDGVNDTDSETPDREELLAEIESLEVQNERLRERYERDRYETYRNTALSLGAVGILALLGAVVLPSERTVLIALGATGLFAAILTYVVTPGELVPASTGEHVYDAFASNTSALVQQLGLSDTRVYVPTADAPGVKLFVPQHEEYVVPSSTELASPIVVTDAEHARGVALFPVGAFLFEDFEEVLADPVASDPEALALQLRDGLTDTLEFAQRAAVTVESGDESASFGIGTPSWAQIGRFDHPVASFIGVGFALGIDSPVEVTVVSEHDSEYDALVRVEWEST